MIAQRTTDGYVNATAMCKANEAEYANYRQNATTEKYFASLSRSLGNPRDPLTITKSTGPNAERGTWVHPKVVIHLAMWCWPAFSRSGPATATSMPGDVSGDREANRQLQPETRAFIVALAAEAGIPTSELFLVGKEGKPFDQDTWVHPVAAGNLSKWLSPRVAAKVTKHGKDVERTFARANGKLFNDYSRGKGAQKYLAALAPATGIPVADLMIINKGGLPGVRVLGSTCGWRSERCVGYAKDNGAL